jgi:hypothetical protein
MTEQTMDLARITAVLDDGGDHAEKVMFPNGYGVSVVRNSWSYGGRNGLFELAVLDADGDLCYDTPVTGDVLGYLTVPEVVQAMKAVAALPAENSVEAAIAKLRGKRDAVQEKLAAKRLEVERLQKESADLTGDILQLEAGL